MHNLKDLRKNIEIFKKKFKDRNLDFNTDEFDKADKNNRELINKKELLEQEKRKVQELQGIADTEAKHLAENVLQELVYESIEGYDSMIFFEDENLTLKQFHNENRLALAKKVLQAQTKARFRRWDYQILKSLKVTG